MNAIERGRLAADVLNNPVYAEAREAIEREITNAWREAKDSETREHLHRMLRCLLKINTVLDGVMRSGEIERKKLERDRSRLGSLLSSVTGARSAA